MKVAPDAIPGLPRQNNWTFVLSVEPRDLTCYQCVLPSAVRMCANLLEAELQKKIKIRIWMSLNALLNITSVGNTSYSDPYSMVLIQWNVNCCWAHREVQVIVSRFLPFVLCLQNFLFVGILYIIMITITGARACGDTAMCIQDILTVT